MNDFINRVVNHVRGLLPNLNGVRFLTTPAELKPYGFQPGEYGVVIVPPARNEPAVCVSRYPGDAADWLARFAFQNSGDGYPADFFAGPGAEPETVAAVLTVLYLNREQPDGDDRDTPIVPEPVNPYGTTPR